MPDSRTDAARPVHMARPQPQAPVAPPADDAAEIVPLPAVLQQISNDSRNRPQQYLDETRVPLGGE